MPPLLERDAVIIPIGAQDAECGQERVHQRRMIGITAVFPVELPVALDDLAAVAEQPQRPSRYEPIEPHQDFGTRSEEHTSELQSLMRISYAVFCLHKQKTYDTY